MKLNAAVTRLVGAQNNAKRHVFHGGSGRHASNRRANRQPDGRTERHGYSRSDEEHQDIESYNNEFADLQIQLYQISKQTFNGSSLFATTTLPTAVAIKSSSEVEQALIIRSVFTSSDGTAGTIISIHKSALLSALTIDNQLNNGNGGNAVAYSTAGNASASANPTAKPHFFASETSANGFGSH